MAAPGNRFIKQMMTYLVHPTYPPMYQENSPVTRAPQCPGTVERRTLKENKADVAWKQMGSTVYEVPSNENSIYNYLWEKYTYVLCSSVDT
jgi:hypothetical protein